jgi:molybdopterin/thiamine biosynthesis adenylyltransferase
LLSVDETLGQAKALCAVERLRRVNPLVDVTPVCNNINDGNAAALVSGHDVVIDALDNGPSRIILARAASEHGIPLVSGAIAGWRGRVFVVYPGDNAAFLWEGNRAQRPAISGLRPRQRRRCRPLKPSSCCWGGRAR